MNGPDHYREAQKIAARVDEMNDLRYDSTDTLAVAAGGMLHAALALTAATLDAAEDPPVLHNRDWDRAQGRIS